MNGTPERMRMIVEVVISSCATLAMLEEDGDILLDEVLSKSKREPVVMTRTLLATALHKYGYSVDTIGKYLGRSKSAISKMFIQHDDLKKSNRLYYIVCKTTRMQIESYRETDEETIKKAIEG